MKTTCHLGLTGLLAFAGAVAAKAPEPLPEWRATRGVVQIELSEPAAAQYGIVVAPRGGETLEPRDGYDRTRHALTGAFAFAIAHGHYAYPAGGSLAGMALVLRDARRSKSLALELVPGDEHGRFVLVDASGAEWFAARDVHQNFDAATGRLAMTHLDLRAGEALARWAKRPRLEGQIFGAMHLFLEGERDARLAKGLQNCLPAIWPGSAGTTTDVVLDRMTSVDARCNGNDSGGSAGLCTGTGSNADARVKIVPSVRLSNAGTSDVPWYRKFSVNGPPDPNYPYTTFDQHPFLVWNVYRIGGDGRIAQIARSGAKHAFFTGNEECACAGGQILFHAPRAGQPTTPQCADTYDYSSNNIPSELGPREEVIARTGVFGRCRSIFDPDCDGGQNIEDPNPETAQLRYRAPVHESELVAAQHPGARWYVEAWYVVRDDVNLYNTMGNREFVPSWVGFWDLDVVDPGAPLPAGPVIDRWVAPGTTAADARNTEVATAKGRLKLAVRVTPLTEGRHRYDYALMNFDYADPVTAGAEPNLEVVSNRGIGALQVPVPPTTSTDTFETHDATGTGDDDWSASRSPDRVEFTAGGAPGAPNTLDWGSMYRFSFVADAAPVEGTATLVPHDAPGAPLTAATLVPDATEILFANGFEAP